MRDYYEILGVDKDADSNIIKKAYRTIKLPKKYNLIPFIPKRKIFSITHAKLEGL